MVRGETWRLCGGWLFSLWGLATLGQALGHTRPLMAGLLELEFWTGRSLEREDQMDYDTEFNTGISYLQ